MSDESTDSELTNSDNTNNNNIIRSRSLLKQVQATLIGRRSSSRNRSKKECESFSSVALLNDKSRLKDNNKKEKYSKKKSTPVAYTNRLSLLNQVKANIIGTRKYTRSPSSTWNYDDGGGGDDDDDYRSLPAYMSITETKPSSKTEDNPNSVINELVLSSPESPVNINIENDDDDKTMLLTNSLNSKFNNDEGQINENNRPFSSSRLHLNKLKDQITQRARNVITKTPSLTSVLINSSATAQSPSLINNNEQVYWTEIFVEKGKDLSVKDISGTSDPYIKILYGNEEKYTTNTVAKSLNPIWNEKLTFFTHDLNIPIYFHVYDHDRIGRDESMGTAKLDLWRLPFEKAYNAILELENEKRNDGKIGLLYVNITITPKSAEFRDEVLRTLAKQTQLKQTLGGRSGLNSGIVLTRRTIDVFVIEGRNLIGSSGSKTCNPYVKLKFGTNKKYRTQTIKTTTNPKWYQSFMYDTYLTDLPPLEITVIDDTSSSGELIGRAICQIAHLDEERTHRIPVDLEDGSGTIDIFVTITGTTPLQEATNDGDSSSNVALDFIPSKLTNYDIDHYKFFSTIRSLNPIFDVGKLEIKIYQARDLSAKDITGKSDPFCIIELDSNRLRTHTIYKTLDPAWNKSFVIPVQDIHSILEITVYDEDTNKSNEFIGKVAIPLLALKNGEKKWFALKDRKCLVPVKGMIEIEATLIYTNLKAVIRTFNPRETAYYQVDGKISVGAIKQHVARIQNMLKGIVDVAKFINYCFRWENPWISFCAFMASLVIVWNFELYMLPCTLLLLFARNAVREYRRGSLGKPFDNIGDETISAVVQPAPVDEEIVEADGNTKEQKKSFIGVIQGIQDTVLEVQGYIDEVASTLERIKNVFNYTVPWLSVLLIIVLFLAGIILYYIPLRYLILAFVINKFTKRFRKPKDYIDNNEIADFLSRLPSDPELVQYRELKILSRIPTSKKKIYERSTSNNK